MNRATWPLLLGGALLLAGCATPSPRAVAITPHGPNAVLAWNDIAAETVNAGPAPDGTPEERQPDYALDLATLNIAIYDAVVAVDRTYRPFARSPVADAAGASAEAAAAAAGYGVLKGLFPSRAKIYQGTYDSLLDATPEGPARARGVAVGTEVAQGVLALRSNDGRWPPGPAYVAGTGAGNFRPPSNPIGAHYPRIRPFTLTSASQFRAKGPPALDSAAFLADFNETRAFGGATNSPRTAAQTEVARFHTEPPFRFWPRNLRQFATSSDRLVENARLMALLWVAHADAIISCFESKYHYNFWRPATAIAAGANPGSGADEWKPAVPTPNHPEYPAAHLCAAGSTVAVLTSVFGTEQIAFRLDSRAPDTTVHAFNSTGEFLSEIQSARIYGGMHFRTSAVDGAALGMNVGKWVAERGFGLR